MDDEQWQQDETVEGKSHFPADRPEAGSNLRLLVRRDVNLEIGQGMEVVEQAPVLPTSITSEFCQGDLCRRRMGILGFGYGAHGAKV